MSFLITLSAFAFALGILILVHEWGHYWVARKCGVKVLHFSLGFGKPIFTRRYGPDQTQWSISLFPLGGYVKMLDEREAEVKPEESHRAFNRMPVYKRFMIVLAGPSSNLLLAVLLYWVLFMSGVPGMKPILGVAPAGSAVAAAGFSPGETIGAVDSIPVKTWEDVRWALLQHALQKGSSDIKVANGDTFVERHLDLSHAAIDDPGRDFMKELGFVRFEPEIAPVIGHVLPEGAGSRAGIRENDEIVAIDGDPVKNWEQLAQFIRKSPGQKLHFALQRQGHLQSIDVVPETVSENEQKIGKLGISPKIDEAVFDKLMITVHYSPLESIRKAISKTWATSVFTLEMLGKMVVGEASLKSIGGPFTIADYAGQSAKMGALAYLNFLALISISLGVLNLLPIPVLDGGHLMYYMAEIIRGRPLSERVMEFGQKVGLLLLSLLMALALYNDLQRLITG